MIEYRRDAPDAVWMDVDEPDVPARREVPQLTPAQVAMLVQNEPLNVAYTEPLVFIAADGDVSTFWRRVVAAGWVPAEDDVKLMTRARTLIDCEEGAEPRPESCDTADAD